MRIEYKILWVEDDTSWYGTTKELFTDSLEDLGFKLIPKRCKTFDDVKKIIETDGLKEFDLVLVDYTLSASPSGDKVIELIRDNPILTDILFYSTNVEDVRESMHRLGLEGVYSSNRDSLEEKFNLVFNTTIKKIQEVNTMRGLIMAETSDLDELMVEIIEKSLDSEISFEIKTYIEDKVEEFQIALKAIAKKKDSKEKIKDGRLFNSAHKAKTINKINALGKTGVEKFYQNYDKEVNSTRNIFAHVKESYEDGVKVLISHATGKKEVFNEKRCVEKRRTLINYRTLLEDIRNKINSFSPPKEESNSKDIKIKIGGGITDSSTLFVLGSHKGADVIVGNNGMAFYIQYKDGKNDKAVMIDKDIDPKSITLNSAIEKLGI